MGSNYSQTFLPSFSSNFLLHRLQIMLSSKINSDYYFRFNQVKQMFQKKGFLCLVVALLLCIRTTSNFDLKSLNLDPVLVQRANAAIASAKTQLSHYDCNLLSGNSGFLGSLFGTLSFNGYQLFTTLTNVMNLLGQIKSALNANNVILGDNNLVNGTQNFVLGNYDIVNGNNDWIIASGTDLASNFQINNVLVINIYQVSLDRLSQLKYGSNKVIQCLTGEQKSAYFSLFGMQPKQTHSALPVTFPLLKILF